ncbi:DUF302 domain-containing protein [Acuticoccus mangrovi]|uniref:DUF302 domain-containing protein n=1 Tax=Acuticoccus mangrovi TaxID=2796142 RepID=A0A934IMC3_9HYPH|nr:DUF302 domain-containing protein [Acuticoccus mangrovi]MBJ3775071.1 DUF302 domain-containing protein [Acuticoccus mangrovi]
MRRFTIALTILLALLAPAAAETVLGSPEGWIVRPTDKPYAGLLTDLKAAVSAEKMGVVTEAGPTEVAAQRGETIPGNRVVGVFRNDFAVTIIRAAPAAMIEAPIRIMVMEEPDGTATLAYKTPSAVFAPYDGGNTLAEAAATLDGIFAAIVERAAD